MNNVGSVVRQIQRGSKSVEMLSQSSRNFAQTEPVTENTFANLQRMQVIAAQLSQQGEQIKTVLEKDVQQVDDQIQDMQR